MLDSSDPRADPIWLEGGGLSVGFDPETGGIRQLRLMAQGADLIDTADATTPPWRIELTDGRLVVGGSRPEITRDEGGLLLRWVEDGMTVVAQVDPGSDGLRFRAQASADDGSGHPRLLEYPIVGRLRRRDPDGGDWLLHPYATGLLVHDPIQTLVPAEADGPLASGFVDAPYPEGFSGATMQFMALGDPGGALYICVEDADGLPKWLDAYRSADGLLEVRVRHGNADYEASSTGWTPPVLLDEVQSGNWWASAQRYRAWALEQPWCARGPVETDMSRPRWLFEDIGLVTFGIGAAADRSPWLRATHEAAGSSVLHILGPDWAPGGQDYISHLPGGLDEWLPARVDQHNLEAIRESGDRFVLFEFDLLTKLDSADADAARMARQEFGLPIKSSDAYPFPFLCPTADFTRRLHLDRDRGLVGEPGVDGFYYDISANNVIAECVAENHPHRPGGGPEIAAAHAALYRETRTAAEDEARRPLALGAEMINERMIGELDFYQARAGGAPAASFETDRLYERIVAGSIELVPLFAAVYHEYGPVRTDGWAKLSAEQGDLVFWNLARVATWGGLPQINAEYSPLESLPGHPAPLTGHYFPLRPEHAFKADPEVLRFLGELATLRTHLAKRFLAYGTMLEPPDVRSETVDLSWFHYNGPPSSPAYDRRGMKLVQAVVSSSWRHRDDVGIVLVNADRQSREVVVSWTDEAIEGDEVRTLVIRDRRGSIGAGSVTRETTTAVVVAPRTAVLLEARPSRSRTSGSAGL